MCMRCPRNWRPISQPTEDVTPCPNQVYSFIRSLRRTQRMNHSPNAFRGAGFGLLRTSLWPRWEKTRRELCLDVAGQLKHALTRAWCERRPFYHLRCQLAERIRLCGTLKWVLLCCESRPVIKRLHKAHRRNAAENLSSVGIFCLECFSFARCTTLLIGRPPSPMSSDRAALSALYHSTGGMRWTDTWNIDADYAIGNLYGVITWDDRVACLELNDHNLTGIPSSLGWKLATRHPTVRLMQVSYPKSLGTSTS